MVPTFFGRLRARLTARGSEGETAEWRARLAEATAAAAQWRSRYVTLRTRAKERDARARDRQDSLEAEVRRGVRRTPSVAALRQALQARIPLARRRAADAAARDRHARFAARSAEYQRALTASSPLHAEARELTIDGLTWWIPAPPTRSAAAIERTLLKQKIPYRSISQARDLAVGGVMLDVGANIGRMAIPRVVLGDFEAVYCAEPDELNYRCLAANVAENRLDGLVLPDRLAISDRVGSVSLHRGKMPGSHRVVHDAGEDRTTAVPSMTLDAWVSHHEVDLSAVTFVKLDTQGSEVHVFAGAARLLEQPQIAWQVEVAPWLLRLAESDPTTLYRILQEHFTHFIDLNADAEGPRLRPIGDLVSALAYLEREEEAHTDVLVYRASVRQV